MPSRWLVTAMLAIPMGARAEDVLIDSSCSYPSAADLTAEVDPFWAAGANGSYELWLTLDPAVDWILRIEAALGGATLRWEQPVAVLDPTSTTVELEVPDGAFLDPTALVYLTDLEVRIVGRLDQKDVVRVFAPPAFLAWPSGQAAGAAVWDEAAQRVEAPLGVLDAAVRARAPDGVTRLIAPVDPAERTIDIVTITEED